MAIPLRNGDGDGGFAACAAAQKWPSNAEPNHFPNRAMLEGCFHLASRWVEAGVAPPHAPLIETDDNDKILTDENGNARGGLRFPDIAVPPIRSYPPREGEPATARPPATESRFRGRRWKRSWHAEHYLSLYEAVATSS